MSYRSFALISNVQQKFSCLSSTKRCLYFISSSKLNSFFYSLLDRSNLTVDLSLFLFFFSFFLKKNLHRNGDTGTVSLKELINSGIFVSTDYCVLFLLFIYMVIFVLVNLSCFGVYIHGDFEMPPTVPVVSLVQLLYFSTNIDLCLFFYFVFSVSVRGFLVGNDYGIVR